MPRPRSPGAWSLSQYRHRPRARSRTPPRHRGTASIVQPRLPSRRAGPPHGRPAALQELVNVESTGEKRFRFGLNPPKWNGKGRRGGQPKELIHFELQRGSSQHAKASGLTA